MQIALDLVGILDGVDQELAADHEADAKDEADEKGGAVQSGVRFYASPTCHHRPEVYGGIGEAEAAKLLKDFFQALR